MSLSLLMSIFIAIIFMTPLMATPISLGLWVIMMALMSASTISFLTSSWFGLILFIIYIGGMLVMFSYFSAISPNQKLNVSILFFIFFMLTNLFLYTTLYSGYLVSASPSQNHPTGPNSLSQLFSATNFMTLIFLAVVLLLMLILVVKITNPSQGPLRPF